MELQPISQVSKNYGISPQTLRYYEQIGLIKSIRKDDTAYRFYDEAVLKQLHSIILLRKLRISVKQIKEILNNQNALTTVEIFERNISELDEEITSLSTIKSILTRFSEDLRAKTDMALDLLNDTNTLSIIDSISFSKNYINAKESLTMEDLNKASETLSKLEEQKSSETIGPVDTTIGIGINQLKPEKFKFEVVKNKPYRFIGKAVYFRNDWGNERSQTHVLAQSAWAAKKWIFETLDAMTEYHTDMPYGGGLYMWDRYDERSQLQGFIIGKFMKADTPIPESMDYFDIPEGYIAKGWGGYFEDEVNAKLRESDEYESASWFWSAEAYPDFESLGKGKYASGYFICCTPK